VPPNCLKREAEISKQDHANLIRMLDVSIETVPYAIVLEYCAGGALHHLVSGDVSITLERFGWPQRMKAALDIASGMAHLHTQQIVHRDLKSMNILLLHQVLTVHDAVHAKVADFGLARYISNDDNKYMTEKIGSWYFMAPELFTQKAIYNTKVDVYSYAIVIYEMLSGTFESGQKLANPQQLVTFSANGGRPAEEAIPETAPAVLQLLMRQSWDVEPSKRPHFSQIVTQLRLGYASMRLDSEFDEAQLLLTIEA
jgi:serine/threonine protein kinase